MAHYATLDSTPNFTRVRRSDSNQSAPQLYRPAHFSELAQQSDTPSAQRYRPGRNSRQLPPLRQLRHTALGEPRAPRLATGKAGLIAWAFPKITCRSSSLMTLA